MVDGWVNSLILSLSFSKTHTLFSFFFLPQHLSGVWVQWRDEIDRLGRQTAALLSGFLDFDGPTVSTLQTLQQDIDQVRGCVVALQVVLDRLRTPGQDEEREEGSVEDVGEVVGEENEEGSENRDEIWSPFVVRFVSWADNVPLGRCWLNLCLQR